MGIQTPSSLEPPQSFGQNLPNQQNLKTSLKAASADDDSTSRLEVMCILKQRDNTQELSASYLAFSLLQVPAQLDAVPRSKFLHTVL